MIAPVLAQRRFKDAYRTLRLYRRFIIELDELLDRYQTLGHSTTPWELIYTSVNDLYFRDTEPEIFSAALYALRSSGTTGNLSSIQAQ
jgi:hypothetical protein